MQVYIKEEAIEMPVNFTHQRAEGRTSAWKLSLRNLKFMERKKN